MGKAEVLTRGEARHGRYGMGKAWHGMAWHGRAARMAWHGTGGHGMGPPAAAAAAPGAPTWSGPNPQTDYVRTDGASDLPHKRRLHVSDSPWSRRRPQRAWHGTVWCGTVRHDKGRRAGPQEGRVAGEKARKHEQTGQQGHAGAGPGMSMHQWAASSRWWPSVSRPRRALRQGGQAALPATNRRQRRGNRAAAAAWHGMGVGRSGVVVEHASFDCREHFVWPYVRKAQ